MSFGCERSSSSPRRVSNFNSKEPQGGIYPHIKFERDRLNTFRVKSVHVGGGRGCGGRGRGGGGRGGGGRGCGGRGAGRGGDAKTIISLNTSFGDIISDSSYLISFSLLKSKVGTENFSL